MFTISPRSMFRRAAYRFSTAGRAEGEGARWAACAALSVCVCVCVCVCVRVRARARGSGLQAPSFLKVQTNYL